MWEAGDQWFEEDKEFVGIVMNDLKSWQIKLDNTVGNIEHLLQFEIKLKSGGGGGDDDDDKYDDNDDKQDNDDFGISNLDDYDEEKWNSDENKEAVEYQQEEQARITEE